MTDRLHCVFLGLSITSSWGNGHATTYRGLLKELSRRGHKVTFLERDVPWYASNREFDTALYCDIHMYCSLEELRHSYTALLRTADVVVVGSYVPDGVAVGNWVTSIAKNCTAFYDIDTPVTLTSLKEKRCEYVSYDLIRKYNVYFSFTGGPTLKFIEQKLGAVCARALYCSVDPSLYYPAPEPMQWDLAYLGTYAADRQPTLNELLVDVARQQPLARFSVAGPQYPVEIEWPENVYRIEHLPARDHRNFYNSQRFTLNVTRHDMIRAGYSPSVRLFEAAACGLAILTDEWAGLDTIFTPGSEILPVRTCEDVASYLRMPEARRLEIGRKARKRTLQSHTAAVRATEFETWVVSSLERIACLRKRSRAALRASPTVPVLQ
ncbi:MAG: glycosyltransferase [Acidobacteriaceae bacterium]|nr:glycosyltransferase [Acidobacteriaceae bacterium]